MKIYVAKKTALPMNIYDERWERADPAALDYGWNDLFPTPYTTTAKMLHDENGFSVKMTSNEWPLRITEMELNGKVCADSCMEVFFTPNKADKDYINIEMSAAGVTLTCIGEKRGNRPRLDIEGEGIIVETLIHPMKGWEVMLYVPYSFVRKHFTSVDNTFRANFYKCGDLTVIPHYSTWNPVLTERPDYHQSSFFGEITLSDEEL